MNQEETNLAKILAKYLNDECNDSEKELLQAWLNESPKNQQVLDDLRNAKTLEYDLIHYNLFDKEVAWKKISPHFLEDNANVTKFNTRWMLMVASILVILSSVGLLYYKKYAVSDEEQLVTLVNGKILKDVSGEILPATTGAILVKSTGEQIILDQSFTLKEDGSVTFDESEVQDQAMAEDEYYELIVPKAKIIHFTMFEGSKIWVNANSRLKIPAKSNHDRKIKLISGEIYLEVAKYEKSKFFVETSNGSVEVLGTKFNVNSSGNYFKTTLVEGSVKLSNENIEHILQPHTSGIWRNAEFVLTKANLNADLAWKNNVFYFNNYSINRIARQIENWYGVKVTVDTEVSMSKSTYSGEIRRDVTLKEVKKMLEFISGLRVSIEGENLNVEK